MYGKDQNTLKNIIENADYDYNIRVSAAQNPAILADLEGSDIFSKFKYSDIMNLYHQLGEEKDIYYMLFSNEGVTEGFLTNVFERRELFEVLSDNDLSMIFNISIMSQDGFFYKRKERIKDGDFSLETIFLATSMMKFIPNMLRKFKVEPDKEEPAIYYFINIIEKFFEYTQPLYANCCYDEDVYSIIDNETKNHFPKIEPPYNPLLFIKVTLAERSLICLSDKKSILEKIKS